MARLESSDVDVLTVGVSTSRAALLSGELSERFAGLSRGVEIAAASPEDYLGDSDQAYGNRVFLRHYCIHLAGPDLSAGMDAFPADVRAARGFNGDVGRHFCAWVDVAQEETARDEMEPAVLARRVARKTLLAVAGLVSVHDTTWTTDRDLAARRWSRLRPELADQLTQLVRWSEDATAATWEDLEARLRDGGTVDLVVKDFRALIGMWT